MSRDDADAEMMAGALAVHESKDPALRYLGARAIDSALRLEVQRIVLCSVLELAGEPARDRFASQFRVLVRHLLDQYPDVGPVGEYAITDELRLLLGAIDRG